MLTWTLDTVPHRLHFTSRLAIPPCGSGSGAIGTTANLTICEVGVSNSLYMFISSVIWRRV